MNNASALLRSLENLGVEVRADGDRIRFRPAERVGPELLERMREHKQGLLRLLRERDGAIHDPLAAILRVGDRRVELRYSDLGGVALTPGGFLCPGAWDEQRRKRFEDAARRLLLSGVLREHAEYRAIIEILRADAQAQAVDRPGDRVVK